MSERYGSDLPGIPAAAFGQEFWEWHCYHCKDGDHEDCLGVPCCCECERQAAADE